MTAKTLNEMTLRERAPYNFTRFFFHFNEEYPYFKTTAV